MNPVSLWFVSSQLAECIKKVKSPTKLVNNIYLNVGLNVIMSGLNVFQTFY